MSTDQPTCQCACHATSGTHRPACTIRHSEAAPGVWSCVPCNSRPFIADDEACVLGHDRNTKRYVGLLCGRHYHHLADHLTEITELAALLPDVLLPGPNGGDRHGTSVEAPAPGRLEVLALTERAERGGTRGEAHSGLRERGDELWDETPDIPALIPTLESWAAMVLEERGIDQQLHGTLTGAVRVLRGQRHWIAAQLWVDEFVDQLAGLHRALASAVGDTMWPKPIGSCPNCQAKLYNTIGADEVTCQKCGSVWAGIHLVRLRLIHEREAATA